MQEKQDIYREMLLREWYDFFQNEMMKCGGVIYGAGGATQEIIKLAQETGVADKIRGLVVTDKNDNPEFVDGFAVEDIHDIQEKDVPVLVPQNGEYKQEIDAILRLLGFHNIYFIQKFIRLNHPSKITDVYMENAWERGKAHWLQKKTEDRERDIAFSNSLARDRMKLNVTFDAGCFYQSFERLGLSGSRPTLYRIEKYGIEDFLNIEQDILDIGCNTGFFDMTIASRVRTVTGIEYEAVLIDMANRVREYIHADNCAFLCGDFIDWYQENSKKYDVIFSFALHRWLALPVEEYIKALDFLLKPSGYLCFESHIENEKDEVKDLEYERGLSALLFMGYVVRKDGILLNYDGCRTRRFAVLQKVNASAL